MRFHLRRGLVLVLGIVLPVVISACGGGVPPPETDTTDIRPAGENADPTAPRVEVFSSTDRFFIDEFRIDFAKLRNIHYLKGFVPDIWEEEKIIPFSEIHEFQFRSVVDAVTFERIQVGRETIQLNPQEIFRLAVAMKDGSTTDFIAIIPRLRGFRDGQRWELQMAGNTQGIQRIVFME